MRAGNIEWQTPQQWLARAVWPSRSARRHSPQALVPGGNLTMSNMWWPRLSRSTIQLLPSRRFHRPRAECPAGPGTPTFSGEGEVCKLRTASATASRSAMTSSPAATCRGRVRTASRSHPSGMRRRLLPRRLLHRPARWEVWAASAGQRYLDGYSSYLNMVDTPAGATGGIAGGIGVERQCRTAL